MVELKFPEKRDLRGRLLVPRCKFNNYSIGQRLVLGLQICTPIALHATDGRPRLGDDAILIVKRAQRPLREDRMQLHPIDRGRRIDLGHQMFEMRGAEVAHPDRANAPLGCRAAR